MTAEQVFKCYRAYKMFFLGTFDIKKYGHNIRTSPLERQPERYHYEKLARKLPDAHIHALFMHEFFFNPNTFITDLTTSKAMSRALVLGSRAENGRPLLEAELYEVAKQITPQTWETWLYGQLFGTKRAVPECLSDVIAQRMSLDVASLVLLIPQPMYHYHWRKWHDAHPQQLVSNWIARLHCYDQLLARTRTGWRVMSHELAGAFWTGVNIPQLIPAEPQKQAFSFA